MARLFGIELECVVPAVGDGDYRTQGWSRGPQIASAIEAVGVACTYAGYSHATQAGRWKIVTDGSIRAPTNYTGLEIVSPPLEQNASGHEQIDRVCTALGRLGATVNVTCGFHVHVGVRDLALNAMKRLAVLYADGEDILDSLLPRSRRGNASSFSRSVKGVELPRLDRAMQVTDIASAINNGQRYSKLNFTSYWKYGTVEFRQHSGTVSQDKVKKWVGLCTAMVESAVRTADDPLFQTASTVPSPYWENGRRTQTLYRLLTRPEGVTSEEAREALDVRSRPNIRWHLTIAGASTAAHGRRAGREIFRLVPPSGAVTPAPRPTFDLSSFMEFLRLPESDREYWQERQAQLREADAPMGGSRTGRLVPEGASLGDILQRARRI